MMWQIQINDGYAYLMDDVCRPKYVISYTTQSYHSVATHFRNVINDFSSSITIVPRKISYEDNIRAL